MANLGKSVGAFAITGGLVALGIVAYLRLQPSGSFAAAQIVPDAVVSSGNGRESHTVGPGVLSSQDPVPRRAAEVQAAVAAPTLPQHEHASTGFFLDDKFLGGPSEYEADPRFNPNGILLSKERRDQFESFLMQVGTDHGVLQKQRTSVAIEFAKSQVAKGHFKTKEQQEKDKLVGVPSFTSGKMLVGINVSGEPTKLVAIGVGDCPELDEIDLVLKQSWLDAHGVIKTFFQP